MTNPSSTPPAMSEPVKQFMFPFPGSKKPQGKPIEVPAEQYIQSWGQAATNGFYPISRTGQWHAGIHFDGKTSERFYQGDDPVRRSVGKSVKDKRKMDKRPRWSILNGTSPAEQTRQLAEEGVLFYRNNTRDEAAWLPSGEFLTLKPGTGNRRELDSVDEKERLILYPATPSDGARTAAAGIPAGLEVMESILLIANLNLLKIARKSLLNQDYGIGRIENSHELRISPRMMETTALEK